jgi:protein-disulfide isomerase
MPTNRRVRLIRLAMFSGLLGVALILVGQVDGSLSVSGSSYCSGATGEAVWNGSNGDCTTYPTSGYLAQSGGYGGSCTGSGASLVVSGPSFSGGPCGDSDNDVCTCAETYVPENGTYTGPSCAGETAGWGCGGENCKFVCGTAGYSTCTGCGSQGNCCSGNTCTDGTCVANGCGIGCGGGCGCGGCTTYGGYCDPNNQNCCTNLSCISYMCQAVDPIIIDTTGHGYAMTNAEKGVMFEDSPAPPAQKTSWTAGESGNAWLALDLNGNGRIDNIGELFSNFMPIPGSSKHAANGFEALAAYDLPQNGGNGDGIISAADSIYPKLLLWIDKNHNGVSEPNELFTMAQLGVASIDLHYMMAKTSDENGNTFRYRSAMTDMAGFHTGPYAYDVLLSVAGGDPAKHGRAVQSKTFTPAQLLAGNPPSKGPSNAPATVTVFSDFQCPFCAQAAHRIAALKGSYGDDLRVVYRYYPLPIHSWAQPAAKAAACANEQSTDAFWKLHDLYFGQQSQLNPKNVMPRSLAALETIPGFDSPAFRRCVAAPSANPEVARDLELGQAAGVSGTPTIFVNGQRVEGVPAMVEAIGKVAGDRPQSAAAADPGVAGGVACPRPKAASDGGTR